ncbi:unnamed protein product, partial [Allacma fusca]
GSNKEKWMSFVLKHVPKDQLPENYGGMRKVNQDFLDVVSCDFSVFDDDWEDPDAGMFVVTVDPRDKIKIALDILHPNTTISWKFYTDDFDIGFSIYYEDRDLFVIPNSRVDSQLKDQVGKYTAILPGRYLLIFDNTYSLIRPKTLYYQVEETPPDGVVLENTTGGVVIKN